MKLGTLSIGVGTVLAGLTLFGSACSNHDPAVFREQASLEKSTAAEGDPLENFIDAIGKIPPVSSVTPDGGASQQEIQVTITCTDEIACKSIWYQVVPVDQSNNSVPPDYIINGDTASLTISGDEGTYLLRFRSEDEQGNIEAERKVTFFIDRTPPKLFLSLPAGLYHSPQVATLKCEDENGSGCGAVAYTLNGQVPNFSGLLPNPSIIVPGGLAPMTIGRTEGLVNLRALARDKAGNLSNSITAQYYFNLPCSGNFISPNGWGPCGYQCGNRPYETGLPSMDHTYCECQQGYFFAWQGGGCVPMPPQPPEFHP